MEIQDKPDQIKYAPKAAKGFMYALGSWVVESTEKTELSLDGQTLKKSNSFKLENVNAKKETIATSLACPGLFGTWPMIDFCHGYAYIVFVKNLLGEERADVHIEMKKIIDKQIASTCK
jgi:hypothetical protein